MMQLMQRKKNDDKNGDASNVTKLISDAEKMKSELGYFKDKLSYKPNNAFDKSAGLCFIITATIFH